LSQLREIAKEENFKGYGYYKIQKLDLAELLADNLYIEKLLKRYLKRMNSLSKHG
jgi:hypothetical protein